MTAIDSPPAAAPVVRAAPRRRFSAGHLVVLVAGLLAALLNYAALRSGDHTVRVATAGRDVAAGEVLGDGALQFTDVRVDEGVLAGLLLPADAEGLTGHVAAAALAEGDLVRRNDLRAPSAPQAQRAMSLPVEVQHAAGGALVAGDRIDVITVAAGRAAYVVTDAEVLAVPQAATRPGLVGAGSYFVTIAVDDATALDLAEALRGDGGMELVRSTGAEAATAARDR